MVTKDKVLFEYQRDIVTFAVRLKQKLDGTARGNQGEVNILKSVTSEAKKDLEAIIQAEPLGFPPHIVQLTKSWMGYFDHATKMLSLKKPKISEARTYLGGPEREEWVARR